MPLPPPVTIAMRPWSNLRASHHAWNADTQASTCSRVVT
jgi:hypothetical protein